MFFNSRSRLGVLAVSLLSAVLLFSPGAGAAAFPAFGLPMAAGQEVSSAGIHADGSTSVRNAIDLTPDDGVVRAPLAGTVRMQTCAGGSWVAVDHDGGWRTGYYHLEDIAVADGQQVTAGTRLGSVGNALPCGGSSTGPHVHFTLWRLDAAGGGVEAGEWDDVPYERLATSVTEAIGETMTGKTFGGWRLAEGDGEYSGTATNVSTGAVVALPGSFRYDG